MISKIITFLALLSLLLPLTTAEQQNSTADKITSKLRKIQGMIERRVHRDQGLKLRFSRLFENIFPNEGNKTALEDVDIVPSISLPYKDNFYYSMMLYKNGNYFSLRGDLIISSHHRRIMVSSVRNQYTYFGQVHQNGTIVILKLKVISRQIDLEEEVRIQTKEHNMEVSHFYVVNPAGQLNYVLVDSKAGRIVFFDRQGQYLRQVKSQGPILQIDRFSNHLLILTENEMFSLGVGRNTSRTDCILPQGSIDSFIFEDSNYRFIYGVKNGYIYQYDLVNYCRPIRSYHLPKNVSLYLTSQVIFAQSQKGTRFALNLTDGSLKPYHLPVAECSGPSKQTIIRKLASQYIISRLCLADEKIIISHILVDFEVEGTDMADFSKFRIPLLLFSFGVIIYVTVKNKKREKVQEQQQKIFQKVLMGKLQSLKDSEASKEQIQSFQATMSNKEFMKSAMKLKAN